MNISLIILSLVLLAIMCRKFFAIHLPVWMIMLIGAIAILATGQISLANAWRAIDWNIIGYLIGVFILGQALEESGYLMKMGAFLFAVANRPFLLLLLIFITQGIASAFLMNDTIAIVMAPLLLAVAKHSNIPPKILLLSLAYAVSIGSVMSPVGNPQNLLIAINGQLSQPFVDFFSVLALPTLINLIIGAVFVYIYFHKSIKSCQISERPQASFDIIPALTRITQCSMAIFVMLIAVKITLTVLHASINMPFFMIALIAAAPIVFFSKQRVSIILKMDWATIIFFMALFIVVESVWDSHVIQHVLSHAQIDLSKTSNILIISALFSQFISNVPLVALYLPMLTHAGHPATSAMLALAVGSTVAGNFLIIGAASNIIIIQKAERLRYHGINAIEFMLLGIPLGLLNLIIYYCFL